MFEAVICFKTTGPPELPSEILTVMDVLARRFANHFEQNSQTELQIVVE